MSDDAEPDERDLTDRKFYRAEQEAGFAEAAPTDTPQTRHPAYRLAFRDTDFLLREELRPVRFQLELLKPEMLLEGPLDDLQDRRLSEQVALARAGHPASRARPRRGSGPRGAGW